MPDIDGLDYLTDILFEIGPIRGELPLAEENFDSWERRRGIELEPWEAQMIVELSREYMGEMHAAKDMSAISPWPEGRKVWMHVTSKKAEEQDAARRQVEAKRKQKEADGPSKRHRNPPKG